MIRNYTNPYWIYLENWYAEENPRIRMQHMGTYMSRYFYKKDITKENQAVVNKLVRKEGRINLSMKDIHLLFPDTENYEKNN